MNAIIAFGTTLIANVGPHALWWSFETTKRVVTDVTCAHVPCAHFAARDPEYIVVVDTPSTTIPPPPTPAKADDSAFVAQGTILPGGFKANDPLVVAAERFASVILPGSVASATDGIFYAALAAAEVLYSCGPRIGFWLAYVAACLLLAFTCKWVLLETCDNIVLLYRSAICLVKRLKQLWLFAIDFYWYLLLQLQKLDNLNVACGEYIAMGAQQFDHIDRDLHKMKEEIETLRKENSYLQSDRDALNAALQHLHKDFEDRYNTLIDELLLHERLLESSKERFKQYDDLIKSSEASRMHERMHRIEHYTGMCDPECHYRLYRGLKPHEKG